MERKIRSIETRVATPKGDTLFYLFQRGREKNNGIGEKREMTQLQLSDGHRRNMHMSMSVSINSFH